MDLYKNVQRLFVNACARTSERKWQSLTESSIIFIKLIRRWTVCNLLYKCKQKSLWNKCHSLWALMSSSLYHRWLMTNAGHLIWCISWKLHSKTECGVVSTQVWVKFGQKQLLFKSNFICIHVELSISDPNTFFTVSFLPWNKKWKR